MPDTHSISTETQLPLAITAAEPKDLGHVDDLLRGLRASFLRKDPKLARVYMHLLGLCIEDL
jgi:hypothetical protein